MVITLSLHVSSMGSIPIKITLKYIILYKYITLIISINKNNNNYN